MDFQELCFWVKKLPGSCRWSQAGVRATSAEGKAGVKPWKWLRLIGKTNASEDQVGMLSLPGSAPPWANAISDCMFFLIHAFLIAMLQVFASFLCR